MSEQAETAEGPPTDGYDPLSTQVVPGEEGVEEVPDVALTSEPEQMCDERDG